MTPLSRGMSAWKLLIGLALVLVVAPTCHGLQRNYRWSTLLIGYKNMELHWNITDTTWWIGLRGDVDGWMGLGVSGGAQMVPSDISLGYFSSGSPVVSDYYADSHTRPTRDTVQNIQNLTGARSGTLLELEFSRPLNSGDSQDRIINPFLNSYLVFAFSDQQPSSPTNFAEHNGKDVRPIQLCFTCTPPGSPVAFTNSSMTSSSIQVSWQPPMETGEASIIGYALFYWQLDPQSSPIVTTNQTIDLPASTLTYNATGLISSTSYGFHVTARNGMGYGTPAQNRSFTTSAAPPAAPTSLKPINASQTSLEIAWNAPMLAGEPLRSYQVQFASSATSPTFNNGCTSGPTTTSCTVNSLTSGTSYLFRVIAINDAGPSIPSEELQAKTNAVGSRVVSTSDFSAPIASNVASNRAFLTWNAPNNDGDAEIMDYTLQRSNLTLLSAPGNFITVFTGRTLNFTDTGLTRRSKFIYRLSVRNGVGSSAFVAQTSAITTTADPPSQPEQLGFIDRGRSYIWVYWWDPVDNGGSPVTSYNLSIDDVPIYGGLTRNFNVTGLNPDQAYLFTATASNAFGTSVARMEIIRAGACNLDSDCSGRGSCNSTKQCVCHDGFAGSFCESVGGALSPDILPGEFPFSFKAVGDSMTVYWRVDSETSSVTFAMEVEGTGWAALGFGKDMSDSDTVVGRVLDDGTVEVRDYTTRGHNTPVLDESLGGSNNLVAFSGKKSGGTTTFKWRRLIDTGDSLDKVIDISATGSQDIIVAHHHDSISLVYHGSQNHDQLKVRWSSGELLSQQRQSASRIAHGTLMAFAWIFLLLGALFAKYTRWFSSAGDLWFKVHRANQTLWSLAVTAAFILAFIMVHKAKTGHFVPAHAIMGLILYGLMTWQVAWAIFRPDVSKDEKGKPIKMQPCMRTVWSVAHTYIGRIATVFAIPVTVTGMYQMRAPTAVYTVYGIIIGFTIVFAIIMEILHCMGKIGDSDKPEMDTELLTKKNGSIGHKKLK